MCAQCLCIRHGIDTPLSWRQSVFIYARSYQCIKHDSIFTSLIIRGWSAWWARACDWPREIIQVRCAIIAGLRHAFADPCTHVSSQGKEDRLVVLLRITRKLMNIVCRLLKSRAAITGWWGLHSCCERSINFVYKIKYILACHILISKVIISITEKVEKQEISCRKWRVIVQKLKPIWLSPSSDCQIS